MTQRRKKQPATPRRKSELTEADLLAEERQWWMNRPERDRELKEIAQHQHKPILRVSSATTDFTQLCTSEQGKRVFEILKSNPRASMPHSCMECEDTGWKSIDENGRRSVILCQCRHSLETARDYADNVPVQYRSARLANYQPSSHNRLARESAQQWLSNLSAPASADPIERELAVVRDHTRRDLMFVGGTGTGKTRLCASLLNEAYALRRRTALFIRAPLFIQLQLEGMDDAERKQEANAWLDRCRRAEPLAIDDIAGAEAGSDYSRRVLLLLYEQRYDAGLHTIWTTNLDLEQLTAFFCDERLTSRWSERADVVEIGGADWRVQDQPSLPSLLLPVKGGRPR